MSLLPPARGPISAFLFEALRHEPHALPSSRPLPVATADEDDLQLALYCCYELHYRGFAGVSDEWEWNGSLLAFRARLEEVWIDRLVDEVGPPAPVSDLERELLAIIEAGNGPSLSAYMAERGTREQFREFAIHRSAYQLKEADPHSWAIPRLEGVPKAALIKIQSDEYGGGRPDEIHAALFARTMKCLGLDATYGSYLTEIPGVTLATVNLISFFGLHRAWRGALLGHLAVFEMCSVGPNGRYSRALSRLGYGGDARAFYDTHVEADAVHEVIALHDLAGGFGVAEPQLAGDVLFGARAIMLLENRFACHLLDAWSKNESSLYRPLPRSASSAA